MVELQGQEWLVDIRKDEQGYRCHRAHMVSPQVGEWTPFSQWPEGLVNIVMWPGEGQDTSDGYITNETLVKHLDKRTWDEDGRCGDYFEVGFTAHGKDMV